MPGICEAIALVLGTAALLGGAIRLGGLRRRRRGTARIAASERLREARGVRLRVEVDASSVFPGMNAARRNVTTADLALSHARFVVASERGVLLDLSAARGRPLRSARYTGPGRLVLEGDAPRMNGANGAFRIEVALDDAEAWAASLRPFVVGAQGIS